MPPQQQRVLRACRELGEALCAELADVRTDIDILARALMNHLTESMADKKTSEEVLAEIADLKRLLGNREEE